MPNGLKNPDTQQWPARRAAALARKAKLKRLKQRKRKPPRIEKLFKALADAQNL